MTWSTVGLPCDAATIWSPRPGVVAIARARLFRAWTTASISAAENRKFCAACTLAFCCAAAGAATNAAPQGASRGRGLMHSCRLSLPRDSARQSCAEGQRSARTHSPHRGLRAMQVRRPWNISRCDSRAQSRCGNSSIRSRSMRSGSVFRDRRSSWDSRPDVRVHGDALVDPEGVAQNDVSRLSPDPRQHPQLPPWSRECAPHGARPQHSPCR